MLTVKQHKMTAVLKKAGAMHLTYYVNRLTTTKVDSTYLAVNQQCITYMCCGRVRTLDHLIGGQAAYPIAQPRRQLLHLCAATSY